MEDDKKNIHWITDELSDTFDFSICYGKSKSDISDFVPVGYYKVDAILDKNGTDTWKIYTDDNSLFDFLSSSSVCFKNLFDVTDEVLVPLGKLLMLYNLGKQNKMSPLDMADYEEVTRQASQSLKKHNDNSYVFYGISVDEAMIETRHDSDNYSVIPFVKGHMSNALKSFLFTASQIDRGYIDENLDFEIFTCHTFLERMDQFPRNVRRREH